MYVVFGINPAARTVIVLGDDCPTGAAPNAGTAVVQAVLLVSSIPQTRSAFPVFEMFNVCTVLSPTRTVSR